MMRRTVATLVLVVGLIAGSSAATIAITSEDAARASLTDCVIADAAYRLGVLSTVPSTAQRCRAYLVSIGQPR